MFFLISRSSCLFKERLYVNKNEMYRVSMYTTNNFKIKNIFVGILLVELMLTINYLIYY